MTRTVIFAFFMAALLSCGENTADKSTKTGLDKTDLEVMNRILVEKDRERIINYIERKRLKMNETPSGLWYEIIRPGKGENLRENDKLVFEYECSLLDGTVCYSSLESGPKEIVLGRSNIEPGLYQGLLMLNPGAEAIFILPPFLAYGLRGDGKKIPSRSIIVYKVNILRAE